MNTTIMLVARWTLCLGLILTLLLGGGSSSTRVEALELPGEQSVEQALAAAQAAPEAQREESYQRVYEAFSRLMSSLSNNSLGNMRRLVNRLNQLVGTPVEAASGGGASASSSTGSSGVTRNQKPETRDTVDDRTDQLIEKLDQVSRETDQHTLRQLTDDVSRLMSTINEAYLRNIRRVFERLDRLVGDQQKRGPANSSAEPATSGSRPPLHQSGDRLDDANQRVPGFPGWDELIFAVDRMQKSFAQFVRSSTRLVTSG